MVRGQMHALPEALIPDAWTVVLRATASLPLGLFPEPRWAGLLKQLLGMHGDDARAARWWFSWPRLAEAQLPAGDEVAFTLYALPAARTELDRLLQQLRRITDAATGLPPDVALAGNLAFVSAQPLAAAASLRDVIEAEATLLRQHRDLRMCLRGPTRWLRPAHRDRSGEARYVHHEREVDVPLLSERLTETLLSLRRDLDIERITVPALGAQVMDAELFWANLSYRNADGRDKPCGGLLGELILRWPDGVPADLAPWLALAQHLGCGQRRGFGSGQFAWETLDGDVLKREWRPAGRALSRLAHHERLLAAYQRAEDDSEGPDDRRRPTSRRAMPGSSVRSSAGARARSNHDRFSQCRLPSPAACAISAFRPSSIAFCSGHCSISLHPCLTHI